MAIDIVVIRHGETEANLAGVWQGHSDSSLTSAGAEQAKRVAARVEAEGFAFVVSSDLGRARSTAAAITDSYELDPAWRELNLGGWEGLTSEQVMSSFPGEIDALRAGEDLQFGGGERVSELRSRVLDGFSRIADRLDDGQRALVVTHGGAIFALVSEVLNTELRGRALRLTNTSLTTVRQTEWGPHLETFNDATHLTGDPVRAEPGATHIYLIRHAESEGNVLQRWQGHTNGPLTEEGHRQAYRIAAQAPPMAALYSSPLDRAFHTAEQIGATAGIAPTPVSELQEMGFGAWENMTREEILAMDGEVLEAIRTDPNVRYGGTGETFLSVRQRVSAAVDSIASEHPAENVGLVSHGTATRALVTGVLGMDYADRFRLGRLANTGVSRLVYQNGSPLLAAWNLTPHLD